MQVLYTDGEEENLNLRKQRWQLIGGDSPDVCNFFMCTFQVFICLHFSYFKTYSKINYSIANLAMSTTGPKERYAKDGCFWYVSIIPQLISILVWEDCCIMLVWLVAWYLHPEVPLLCSGQILVFDFLGFAWSRNFSFGEWSQSVDNYMTWLPWLRKFWMYSVTIICHFLLLPLCGWYNNADLLPTSC